MLICSEERVENKIKTFSKFGDTGFGGITRFSLSKEAIKAREEFEKRMRALGANIERDDIGNIYATISGTKEDLPRIVMGSHCDSVKNGGNYDGILGVIGTMEVIETIILEKIQHKHPITAMIWTNEEGALYPPAMMSSGIVCGKFNKEKMLNSKNYKGKTFGEALKESGYIGDEKNRLNERDYMAMLELHIEQGPILEDENKEIGIVEGVVGMVNYKITALGKSDHAGTTPMKNRKDALLAATSIIRYLHEEFDKLDEDLVYTTGEIICQPNIHTIIPNLVEFSLDARHKDKEVIQKVIEVIKTMPKEFDGCKVEYKEEWSRNTVDFDINLIKLVQKSTDEYGYRSKNMYSGAGHDAQYVAEIIPTTMIFVPSKNGRSHCEEEFTALEDCVKGINVLLKTVLNIDKSL